MSTAKRNRQKEARRIRESGALAYREGKGMHQNPWTYGSNQMQWLDGYVTEQRARPAPGRIKIVQNSLRKVLHPM